MRHWSLTVWMTLAGIIISSGIAYGSSITLRWTDTSFNETLFAIERQRPNGRWVEIGTISANAKTYMDTAVRSGARYCYRVKAENGQGQSAPSNVACIVAR